MDSLRYKMVITEFAVTIHYGITYLHCLAMFKHVLKQIGYYNKNLCILLVNFYTDIIFSNGTMFYLYTYYGTLALK